MAILPHPDPVPDRPLIYRIDLRGMLEPDASFWHRMRKQYLPRFCGQAFWVGSDDVVWPSYITTTRFTLPRRAMLAYAPPFLRLSCQQSFIFMMRYIRRERVTKDALAEINNLGLIRRGRITTLGWNSYHLSP